MAIDMIESSAFVILAVRHLLQSDSQSSTFVILAVRHLLQSDSQSSVFVILAVRQHLLQSNSPAPSMTISQSGRESGQIIVHTSVATSSTAAWRAYSVLQPSSWSLEYLSNEWEDVLHTHTHTHTHTHIHNDKQTTQHTTHMYTAGFTVFSAGDSCDIWL